MNFLSYKKLLITNLENIEKYSNKLLFDKRIILNFVLQLKTKIK
jgi:hypothetical protein